MRGSTRYSDIYCGGWKIISLVQMRLFKTKIFEKKHSFQGMKKNRLFFLALSNTKTVGEQKIRHHNVFQQVWCKIFQHFLGPRKSRNNFFNIKAIILTKKNFGPFLPHYPLGQTLSNLLLGSTRYLGIYGASYKIVFLGPKRLFFKTHNF